MLRPFRLHEPETAEEACALLCDLGEDAAVYAGGTELLLAMKEGLLRYAHLVNIKPLGLSGIADDEPAGCLRLGAAATHRSLEQSPAVRRRAPLLAEVEARVANARVRAVGTIGGNLCFAEPHSDVATVLLLYGAAVAVQGPSARRRVPVGEFLIDAFTTCLQPGEIAVEVAVPPLPPGAGAAYQKFAFLERPSVGAGAVLVPGADGAAIAEARVAVGCVAGTPFRVPEAEAALRGAPLREGPFHARAAEAAEAVRRRCDPPDDLYGSGEYKRHLAGVLVRRALALARERVRAGQG
jgi:carbon-monoxide dehydrogenase medium subunit